MLAGWQGRNAKKKQKLGCCDAPRSRSPTNPHQEELTGRERPTHARIWFEWAPSPLSFSLFPTLLNQLRGHHSPTHGGENSTDFHNLASIADNPERFLVGVDTIGR
jgi:hypothetical protein